MPTTIYLRSGDEFTVTQPYAVALDRWSARTDTAWLAEFTAVYWRDPKHARDDDEDDDEERWPLYRESPVSVDLTSVIAVERIAGPQAASIERARRYEADRADRN
jgi:hypothetical protein